MNAIRNDKTMGFTLLEVMVAIAIVTILLVGITATLLKCMQLDRVTMEKNIAFLAAKDRIERLKGESFSTLDTLNNTEFDVAGLNKPVVSGVAKKVGKILVTNVTGNTNLKDIKLELIWQGVNGIQTYTMVLRVVNN